MSALLRAPEPRARQVEGLPDVDNRVEAIVVRALRRATSVGAAAEALLEGLLVPALLWERTVLDLRVIGGMLEGAPHLAVGVLVRSWGQNAQKMVEQRAAAVSTAFASAGLVAGADKHATERLLCTRIDVRKAAWCVRPAGGRAPSLWAPMPWRTAPAEEDRTALWEALAGSPHKVVLSVALRPLALGPEFRDAQREQLRLAAAAGQPQQAGAGLMAQRTVPGDPLAAGVATRLAALRRDLGGHAYLGRVLVAGEGPVRLLAQSLAGLLGPGTEVVEAGDDAERALARDDLRLVDLRHPGRGPRLDMADVQFALPVREAARAFRPPLSARVAVLGMAAPRQGTAAPNHTTPPHAARGGRLSIDGAWLEGLPEPLAAPLGRYAKINDRQARQAALGWFFENVAVFRAVVLAAPTGAARLLKGAGLERPTFGVWNRAGDALAEAVQRRVAAGRLDEELAAWRTSDRVLLDALIDPHLADLLHRAAALRNTSAHAQADVLAGFEDAYDSLVRLWPGGIGRSRLHLAGGSGTLADGTVEHDTRVLMGNSTSRFAQAAVIQDRRLETGTWFLHEGDRRDALVLPPVFYADEEAERTWIAARLDGGEVSFRRSDSQLAADGLVLEGGPAAAWLGKPHAWVAD